MAQPLQQLGDLALLLQHPHLVDLGLPLRRPRDLGQPQLRDLVLPLRRHDLVLRLLVEVCLVVLPLRRLEDYLVGQERQLLVVGCLVLVSVRLLNSNFVKSFSR